MSPTNTGFPAPGITVDGTGLLCVTLLLRLRKPPCWPTFAAPTCWTWTTAPWTDRTSGPSKTSQRALKSSRLIGLGWQERCEGALFLNRCRVLRHLRYVTGGMPVTMLASAPAIVCVRSR